MSKTKINKSVLIFYIFLISLGSILSYIQLSASWSGTEEDLPKYIQAPTPYDVICDTNSTHCAWYNGTTGKREGIGTDHGQIVNYARGNLTSGRSHKEWIRFKGEYTITTIITTDDHLGLDLSGAKFTLGANIGAMFQSDGWGTDARDEDVHFLGGVLIGKKAGGYSGGSLTQGSGIRGSFHELIVDGTHIYEFDDYGIHLKRFGSNNKVDAPMIINAWIGGNKWGQGNEDGGLYIESTGSYGVNDGIVERTFFINNGDFNVKWNDNCAVWRFQNNHLTGGHDSGNDNKGIWADGNVDKVHIINNHFEQQDTTCIWNHPQSNDFNDMWFVGWNDFYECSLATNNTYATVHFDSTDGGQCRYSDICENGFASDTSVGGHPNYMIKAKYCIHLDGSNTQRIYCLENICMSGASWDSSIEDDGTNNELEHNYLGNA